MSDLSGHSLISFSSLFLFLYIISSFIPLCAFPLVFSSPVLPFFLTLSNQKCLCSAFFFFHFVFSPAAEASAKANPGAAG